jgi:hypothetical protein
MGKGEKFGLAQSISFQNPFFRRPKMKKVRRVKKQRKQKNQVSQEELFAAIAGLEQIVMAKEPQDWEDEGEVRERTSKSNSFSQRKGKR